MKGGGGEGMLLLPAWDAKRRGGHAEVANQKTRQTILYQNVQKKSEQKKNSFFKFQSQLLNLCYMVMVIVVI